MKLKNYQLEAIAKLHTTSLKLLDQGGTKQIAFKAPTGSGKTVMTAELLKRFAECEMPGKFCYLWISSNNLHIQSKKAVSGHLTDSRYSFLTLDEISEDHFEENQIVFVNWESLTKQNKKTGEFINTFMKDTEEGRNLQSLLANARQENVEPILFIDESHYHYWSDKSQELVNSVIDPRLIIEVSATPAVIPTPDDIVQQNAGYISVPFEAVVAEGMIKTSVIINPSIKNYSTFINSEDEAIIAAAAEQHKALKKKYREEGVNINPLVIIQLPSETQSTSALDATKLELTEELLADKHGITTKNGKLAVWLSDRKDNIEGISEPDSKVEVMIFKQAVALGWDCPRAHILVMFRDIKVKRFEIQTVGRIMRMPEAKHYDDEPLNIAYVFTNLEKIEVAHDGDSQGYFRIYRAIRKKGYKHVRLASTYLHRIDFGDLTLSFRGLFADAANKHFGITSKDNPDTSKKKAERKISLSPKKLTKILISDAIIKNIDEQVKRAVVGREKAEFELNPGELKRAFEAFAKSAALPYAPVRSHTKIQQAIYEWFDKQLGYEKNSRMDIQKIIVCCQKNQQEFFKIIEAAKKEFKEADKKDKAKKQKRKAIDWDVPETEYFNDRYEKVNANLAALVAANEEEKTLLNKERSKPEHEFEKLLEDSDKIDWWYKNGESREIYFAIPYTDPDTETERAFYPDYIVRFKDKSVGIYDPKSGITAKIAEPKVKALEKYIKENKNMKGGIVMKEKDCWYIFPGGKFSTDIAKWSYLEI